MGGGAHFNTNKLTLLAIYYGQQEQQQQKKIKEHHVMMRGRSVLRLGT